MSDPINYAKLFGFHSIPAAVILAVCYLPLGILFLPKLIAHRSYLVFTITLFCWIRLGAFILRAVMIASKSAAEDENVFIADEVLFSIGFFGLLYGAYGLVVDRLELRESSTPATHNPHPLMILLRNRKLFHLALTGGVIMGIIGITNSTGSSPSSSGNNLRKASLAVFVVLTILQALQTFTLVMAERSDPPEYRSKYMEHTIGARHGAIIFILISVLLLVREIYMLATIGSVVKQNKEATWYPFVALPELVCVALYAIPGIIPPLHSYTDLPR
ncbi:hypothetical protein D9757_011065 [Collybiopsis confluens]|uniref:DUF7702 domain-containing protein n=1 Tax=Collybiopsis confluens TaxID=2823264 RepID=A0A8H5LTN3_9AGAR|nr:hypothetical protein D9757_011065 [Collybiopsis confluens]